MSEQVCALCGAPSLENYFDDGKHHYLQCPNCQLVALDSAQRLSLAEERAYYELHENSPNDPGYRKFLSRIADPLIAALNPPAKGLDFGCGPGPTLSRMLEEHGFEMHDYDPAFFPDRTVLKTQYDLITATEVLEHLHNPGQTLKQLLAMIRPGGTLAAMTTFLPEKDQFAQWHYRRDPTHIHFYSVDTFHWVASHYELNASFPAPNVVFFRKQ